MGKARFQVRLFHREARLLNSRRCHRGCHHLAVATSGDVTGLFPELVEAHRESRKQPLHPDTEDTAGSAEQDTKLVRYDRVSLGLPAAAPDVLGQRLPKAEAGAVARKIGSL